MWFPPVGRAYIAAHVGLVVGVGAYSGDVLGILPVP